MKRCLGLFSTIILLSACQTNLPEPLAIRPTPVLSSVYSSSPLTIENVFRATELATFPSDGSGLIAALAFTPDGQELLGVYSQEGQLRRWRVEDGVLLDTIDIGQVGTNAVAFNAEATLLAAGAGKAMPMAKANHGASFHGARLWDTLSGKMILEVDPDREPYTDIATDVALSADGRWLAIAEPGSLDVWDTNNDKPAELNTLMGTLNQTTISSVVFDPSGEWLVYTDIGGGLTREKWNQDSPELLKIVPDYVEEMPLTLAIDPSRRFIALVTSKLLVVRRLQAIRGDSVLEKSLSPTRLASLAFSPDGKLLAVGTDNGWQVWSVADGKLLLENNAPTYAVAFSPDGRLFAWGDTNGIVHIWGVKD